MGSPRTVLRNQLLLALAVSVLTTVIVAWALALTPSNFGVPIAGWGDAASTLAVTKGVTEGGSFADSPWLGAPGTMVLRDSPNSDALNLLLLWILAKSFGSAPFAVNAFLLLTYALASGAATFVALRLKLWPLAAAFVGVLYGLAPYHFVRGMGHLFLSNYWIVPFVGLLAVRLMYEMQPLAAPESTGWRKYVHARTVGGALICIAAAASGIYYAAFACFVFAVAGIWGWPRYGKRNAIAALLMIALIGLVVVAQLVPSVVYQRQAGPNPGAVNRGNFESEVYGFRLTQMVFPAVGHRYSKFDQFKVNYYRILSATGIIDSGEGDSAVLGLFATLGFIALFAALLLARARIADKGHWGESLVARLAVLNVFCFVLGTAGGLGALIGWRFGMLRGYNRVSIVIAWFALLAVGIFITWVASKATSRWARIAAVAFCLALIVAGVLDQVPERDRTRGSKVANWRATDAYVKKVEGQLGKGAMVFQLPFVAFPESPPTVKMPDYEHFIPYLHSTGVRWSYGAMKGRPVSEWQKEVSALGVRAMLPRLKAKGFDGVWVDTFGYEDSGQSLIEALQAVTGSAPLKSDDGRYAFFVIP